MWHQKSISLFVLALILYTAEDRVPAAEASGGTPFEVKIVRDIAYGKGRVVSADATPVTSVKELLLDAYLPVGADTPDKATVILIHGGGFTGGDKSKPRSRQTRTGPDAARERKAEVGDEVIKLYELREFKGMPYRLLRPIDFDPSKTYPLILSLHGKGGSGSDNVKQLMLWTGTLAKEELRREHPCFVVCPQTTKSWSIADEKAPKLTEKDIAGYSEFWQRVARRMMESPDGAASSLTSGGDLSKAFDLVESLAQEFPLDRNRIYVIGHSMGAFGAWNSIYERPELFAAAIPAAGGFPPWKDARRFANVPVWAFHGGADALLSPELTRAVFAAMKQCGGNMKYTELAGINHGSNVPGFN